MSNFIHSVTVGGLSVPQNHALAVSFEVLECKNWKF